MFNQSCKNEAFFAAKRLPVWWGCKMWLNVGGEFKIFTNM